MNSIFHGCLPALMTPCDSNRHPDYRTLVSSAIRLMDAGMNGVVYCGSMGEWPLLTDQQRQEGVSRLCAEGIPVVVGTGAISTKVAVEHAVHAVRVGASGLMLIPRLLSRATSPSAQRNHFAQLLSVAPEIPCVIYNSPYYGFETKAELFFDLHREHRNLVGFKEFGGAGALDYAAEHITQGNFSSQEISDRILVVGVDTQVYHGYLHCGAKGAITGIGNVLPLPVLHLIRLCERAVLGDSIARRLAQELSESLKVLSRFDEGPDLVLYYKYLLELSGLHEYRHQLNATDRLSQTQRGLAEEQFEQFNRWWAQWPGRAVETNRAVETIREIDANRADDANRAGERQS